MCSAIVGRLAHYSGLVLIVILWLPVSDSHADDSDQPSSKRPPLIFEKDILPLLKTKCTSCHNPKSHKGELDLTTMAGIRRGSESGSILTVKKPEDSLLFEMVHDGLMPPEEKNPLSKPQIELIRRWITSGARSKESASVDVNQHDVIPILHARCVVCHGLRRKEAGLDLRTKAGMLRGGKSGPAIVPGKPEESLLVKRIHAKEMPPGKLLVPIGVRPVESGELVTLKNWIAAGAPELDIKPDVATAEPDLLVTDEDRKFWSFQAPRRPAVPIVKHQELVNNPIDAFVLRRLEAAELTFATEADRVTLIRRAAFDLTGLPPKWEDVERFLSDDADHAYERMLDRYLNSRQYGERWGQYWLDLAGYADSEGKRSADPIRPHAWRYRDYVIRAFNDDKPYDRFLLEQIAGDELVDYENAPVVTREIMDNLIATGFLRMAPDGTGSDIVNTVAERFEVIADEMEVFGSVVLGLTLKCAQCHSHKYDPIPQRDYYRLVAVFQGAYDPYDWLKPSFVPGQTKAKVPGRVLSHVMNAETQQWVKLKKPVESQIAATKAELKKRRGELEERALQSKLTKLPKELHADLRVMLATQTAKRNQIQKYLAKKFEKRLQTSEAELTKLDPKFKKLLSATQKKIKDLQAKMPAEPRIRALWDRGVPSPTYIFRRGEFTNPGRLVGPGVPTVLTDGKTPFDAKPPWKGAKKTGNRLALAKWLIQPNHPLTARVMINRIWFHHYGRGIVESLSNFGNTGTGPSHPELLDWLATEFVSRGWSIKQMHRLMMTSRAYWQTSKANPRTESIDADNSLYSRMTLRRMEAEVLRDSTLAVADQLDLEPFGAPDQVTVRPDGLVTANASENGWRRSIYVQHRRKEMPTVLETFDLPQMIPNCTLRPDSTVASQALYLMNNATIRQLADSFGKRVQKEVGNERYRQVERVYQIALSRMPTEQERELGIELLERLSQEWQKQLEKDQQKSPTAQQRALANYCHTIMNSAAFLFID